MLESDVRLLNPSKLAAMARYYGLKQQGKKGLWCVRKSVTDPRTHEEHEFRRATKTADLRLAVYRASTWVDEFIATVHASRLPTMGSSSSWASLDQVKEVYLRAAACAPATRKKNFQRLEGIVEDMYSARNPALGSVSTEIFDGRLARLWQLQRKSDAEGTHLPHDEAACEQSKRGANAVYRQARSVFSAAMLRAYEDAGLRLSPHVAAFARQGFLPAAPPPPAEQIDAAVVAKIWRLMPRLREVRPAIWAAVLLMFRGGCRNSEAAKARWSWLLPALSGEFALQIHTRGDFKPKARPRLIRLAPEVVKLLQTVQLASDDHLVPMAPVVPKKAATPKEIEAATAKARTLACNIGVNKFLRACGVTSVKGKIAYRLRGHAITEIILAHGMDAAQEFAGHTSRHTTEIYKGTAVPYTPLGLPAAATGR